MAVALPLLFLLGAQADPVPPSFPSRPGGPRLDVPFVATPPAVVEAMLDLAAVRAGDHVIDLGTGDGRILIAAARRGARGLGVDLDPDRIREAEANAVTAGVAHLTEFRAEDLFDTPLREASVVAMYLLPSINVRLRPRLLKLRPGTRIVSHAFDSDGWRPDRTIEVDGATVHFWVVPARVQGRWVMELRGRRIPVRLDQRFQDLNGTFGKSRIGDGVLLGDVIRFVAPTSQGLRFFEGRIHGDTIEPVAAPSPARAPAERGWRMVRVR